MKLTAAIYDQVDMSTSPPTGGGSPVRRFVVPDLPVTVSPRLLVVVEAEPDEPHPPQISIHYAIKGPRTSFPPAEGSFPFPATERFVATVGELNIETDRQGRFAVEVWTTPETQRSTPSFTVEKAQRRQ